MYVTLALIFGLFNNIVTYYFVHDDPKVTEEYRVMVWGDDLYYSIVYGTKDKAWQLGIYVGWIFIAVLFTLIWPLGLFIALRYIIDKIKR